MEPRAGSRAPEPDDFFLIIFGDSYLNHERRGGDRARGPAGKLIAAAYFNAADSEGFTITSRENDAILWRHAQVMTMVTKLAFPGS